STPLPFPCEAIAQRFAQIRQRDLVSGKTSFSAPLETRGGRTQTAGKTKYSLPAPPVSHAYKAVRRPQAQSCLTRYQNLQATVLCSAGRSPRLRHKSYSTLLYDFGRCSSAE